MRRRLVRLLLLLVAVVGGAYLVFAFLVALPGGPIDGSGRGVRAAAAAGGRLTVRAFTLRNDSSRRVELKAIKLRGARGVRLLGTSVQTGGSRAEVSRGYPPSVRLGRLADVDGFRMPPARGGRPGRTLVVLGLSGRGRIDGITVRYRDRSLRRSRSVDGRVVVGG